jgi:hypothetical protein
MIAGKRQTPASQLETDSLAERVLADYAEDFETVLPRVCKPGIENIAHDKA